MNRYVKRLSTTSNRGSGRIAGAMIGVIALAILAVGCLGTTRVSVTDEALKRNLQYWQGVCASLKVGDEVARLPISEWAGLRTVPLKWDVNREVSDLLIGLNHVTSEGIDLEPLRVTNHYSEARLVGDLPFREQQKLRTLWEERILSALTTKYFETDPDLLRAGLRQGDLMVYYILLGRHASAQMGRTDGVRFICVNERGVLVSKIAEQYGCGYPLGFVDQRGPLEGILF